jgi:hypothetical protein
MARHFFLVIILTLVISYKFNRQENCNVNYPKIIKIAPKEKHNFQTQFHCKNGKEAKIKLEFDFYSVGKSFYLKRVKLRDIR